MTTSLSIHELSGGPAAIGRQHGEALRPLVRQHLEGVLERLGQQAGWNGEVSAVQALRYRVSVRSVAPDLDTEIAGLAEGAGISLGEAYLLQLRAEVGRLAAHEGHGTPADGAECTTFSLAQERTAGFGPVVGGNADLPSGYGELMVGLRIKPDAGSPIFMVTPAGQVSYVGMNADGLGVFANTILCGGWRLGFPRYLMSRLILAEKTVSNAQLVVSNLVRAASRNLIMMDHSGDSRCLETTPTRVGVLEPVDGVGVHSNHLIANETRDLEEGTAEWMVDSQGRHDRLRTLLTCQEPIGESQIQTALRDRENLPYALSREPGEDGSDFMTVFSTIAKPHHGELSIAVGPPHLNEYETHSVEA